MNKIRRKISIYQILVMSALYLACSSVYADTESSMVFEKQIKDGHKIQVEKNKIPYDKLTPEIQQRFYGGKGDSKRDYIDRYVFIEEIDKKTRVQLWSMDMPYNDAYIVWGWTYKVLDILRLDKSTWVLLNCEGKTQIVLINDNEIAIMQQISKSINSGTGDRVQTGVIKLDSDVSNVIVEVNYLIINPYHNELAQWALSQKNNSILAVLKKGEIPRFLQVLPENKQSDAK